jgi:hypothetical protein
MEVSDNSYFVDYLVQNARYIECLWTESRLKRVTNVYHTDKPPSPDNPRLLVNEDQMLEAWDLTDCYEIEVAGFNYFVLRERSNKHNRDYLDRYVIPFKEIKQVKMLCDEDCDEIKEEPGPLGGLANS